MLVQTFSQRIPLRCRKFTALAGVLGPRDPGSDGFVVVVDPGDVHEVVGLRGDPCCDCQVPVRGGYWYGFRGFRGGFADCGGVWVVPDEFVDAAVVGEAVVGVGRASAGMLRAAELAESPAAVFSGLKLMLMMLLAWMKSWFIVFLPPS